MGDAMTGLDGRIKKLEIEAQPLAAEMKRERCGRLIGRFGMMRLLAWGFTHSEALDVLAESNKRVRPDKPSLLSVPHWTGQHIFDDFQAFIAADKQASEVYQSISDYRTEDMSFRDTIAQNCEAMAELHSQLWARLREYFLEIERGDFLDYEVMFAEGVKRQTAHEKPSIESGEA